MPTRAIRHRRWLAAVIVLMVVWGAGLVGTATWYGTVDRAQHAAAIVVLGSGLKDGDVPSSAFEARVAHAALLYADGLAPVVVCSGGTLPGRGRSEAEVCRDLLAEKGVPFDAVLLEEASQSTLENAACTAVLLREQGLNDVVLVTSRFHLLRAAWLFGEAGVTIHPSGAPDAHLTAWERISVTAREVAAFHVNALQQAIREPLAAR